MLPLRRTLAVLVDRPTASGAVQEGHTSDQIHIWAKFSTTIELAISGSLLIAFLWFGHNFLFSDGAVLLYKLALSLDNKT